jgi:protein-tyrosine phosphatase
MKRLLFLCSGNYYRSRFAEHLFNWLAENAGLHWRADSRGLDIERFPKVAPVSPFTVERLRAIGVPIDGDSRWPMPLAEADLQHSDLVVAVKEAEHRPLMRNSFPHWAEQVEYWHIDDIDCAAPAESLPSLEEKVHLLVHRLRN